MSLKDNDFGLARVCALPYAPAVPPPWKIPEHPIGRNIAQAMKREGLNPAGLAKRMRVTPQQVNDLLRRNEPDVSTLTRVATQLKTSVESLIVGFDAEYDLSRHGVQVPITPSKEGKADAPAQARMVQRETHYRELLSYVVDTVRAIERTVEVGLDEEASHPPAIEAAGGPIRRKSRGRTS